MANKFGLGSLPLETKKPNTTAWINKAKPYFLDQIGDTLQGDLDMNNFSITNLKSPENDNDAIHKKYLMEQLNLIEVNKEHLKERINDVKRFFKRQINNKDYIDDTKLQQEVTSLKNFIQQQLVNVVDKTKLQTLSSLISNLDDKITKQKIDLKQLLANINPDISEDKLQRELTKLNSELQKELTNILQNIDIVIQQQNIDDSEIKTYIHQQKQNIDDSVIQQQITTINNLVLKQDKNILALEKQLNQENKSYYFNLPFRYLRDYEASITDNSDKSKDNEYKKFGFTANIRVYKQSTGNPHRMFSDVFSALIFRGKLIIKITFPFQVKVDSIVFRQNSRMSNKKFNARKVLQFINGTENVETKELEINDENNKVDHLCEIKTSGKYIDRFRMLIIPDNEEDFLTLTHFDMLLETETPPSMNIIRNPETQKGGNMSYEFLRTTDFEYVKLYFVDNGKFTSIDIHKSQQNKEFIIRDDVFVKIFVSIEKPKFSVHLNKINDSKEQISLVTVKVFIEDSKHKVFLSEVHLI
ncbi:hypothetical protein LOTGIDRAFT_155944 [Lottia gigantea]|uniref:Uncharacterized protein n=1 Tax=Lottia gigantea TaxID=225164 RepID=V3ZFN8_LOTGI|nr:hypothetical protein LOTGIDRAFT_155944 [Lottia gigantea]ESO82902.1 hypothetical protein LOTGIDRAFT_155944 [Lottia gigantea]